MFLCRLLERLSSHFERIPTKKHKTEKAWILTKADDDGEKRSYLKIKILPELA